MSDAGVSYLSSDLPVAPGHQTTVPDTPTASVSQAPTPTSTRPQSPDKPRLSGLGLDIHNQARRLVRLIQCPVCSKPLSRPVTLPCGRSLCLDCLPPSSIRERAVYPDVPGRRQIIACFDPVCGQAHNYADCPQDVVLRNVVVDIAAIVASRNSNLESTDLIDLYQLAGNRSIITPSNLGRLIDTYNLASLGLLGYGDGITYDSEAVEPPISSDDNNGSGLHLSETTTGNPGQSDEIVLQELFESTYKELDCQICYALLLDPITTPCGHTFCRACLRQSLSHSPACAACRQVIRLPHTLRSVDTNKTLRDFLVALSPETIASRARQVELQNGSLNTDTYEVPLFVVGNAFPGTPMFLRIFEPRYRLMLRRVLAGDMTFGMVSHNPSRAGDMPFMTYGTRMRIRHAQQLEDGTSMIEATGIERFRITNYSILDNYYVGLAEPVEDVPLAEEERLEVAETSDPLAASDGISNMPTMQMLARCLGFINVMRAKSQHWLNSQLLMIHGPPPNDAAVFPYWLAAVLPIDERMAYQLLATNSVRQRLKLVTGWIARLEAKNVAR